MDLKWQFVFINILVQTSSYLEDPNDSPDYLNYRVYPNKDIRRNFHNKRRHDRLTAKRVKLLDQITDDNVFVNGIVHYKIDSRHVHYEQVNNMEKAFRNLIGMKGVKYIYRRDPYWRTWRRVKYPDGQERVICYRCQNSVNCTSCQYSGYWVIEDNPPPCPFEIVALINNEELCAANLTNSTNIEKDCPSVVQFSNVLGICDNPIATKWRIQKNYKSNASERYPAILCNGRDFCEISTFYTITRDYVSFSIVNSTNHITYSRVMKNDQKNYACVFDCGIMNPITKAVSKTDKPLVVDLINNKNKRHDKLQHKDVLDTSTVAGIEKNLLKNPKFVQAWNDMEDIFNLQDNNEPVHHHHHHHQNHPSCSSLKHLENVSDDD